MNQIICCYSAKNKKIKKKQGGKKKKVEERACGYFGCVHEFLHLLVRWDTYHTTVTIRAIRGNGNRNLALLESFSVLVRFLHAQEFLLAWIL